MKLFTFLSLCIFFLVFTSSMEMSHGRRRVVVQFHKPCYHSKSGRLLKTIIVGSSGRENFSSIQAAIDSVPSDNRRWICIRVLPGVYREKVIVDKPYLILKGAGKRRTKIVWDDHQDLQRSATFTVVVDNFVAKGMTFINSYNLPEYEGDRNARVPAAAGYISGDKCTFIRCAFVGVQDTLWDVQGRHYFYRNTIVGSVDFILGAGQSLYEDCTIYVLGGILDVGTAGFITSQSRTSPYDKNGFVFRDGIIIGRALTYLGRPWGPYARVLFYNTTMSDIVVPQGWDAWSSSGQEYKLTFAESKCKGPGANKNGRVSWETKLTQVEIQKLTSLDYINSDKWLYAQPIDIL